MIRVLHVLTDSNIGGAGGLVLALLDHMDRSAFHTEVALPIGSRLIPALSARGVMYTELPHLAERSFSWKAVWGLYRLFRQKRPMIVHTHAALSGRLAARLYGRCRVAHTRHSVFTQPADTDNKSGTLTQRLSGVINNTLSDAVIAVSPAARDDLRRTGVKDPKIHVIYNGTPPVRERNAEEKAALRIKYGIPPNAFVAAHLARLTEVKGHDYVLDAARGLLSEPDMLILLAGDGERRTHLEQRLAEEKIGNVRLLGFVEAADEIENIMDVQINASFGTEATSMSLLEGMSLGKPAVVSDYGGNPYVITHEENGLLFPQKDASALRDALVLLKRDAALRERLSEGAHRTYRERFSADEMAARTEALYRAMLNQ